MINRGAGILLPIFSFPSQYGIGTFGKEAYKFIDFLEGVGFKYWQILPIHPLTYGCSPYMSTSSFAGNPYLIDLEMLCEEGLISKTDCDSFDYGNDKNRVDYIKTIKAKKYLITKAANNFLSKKSPDFESFKEEFKYFLDEYSIFYLLKEKYSGLPYNKWDKIHRLHYDDVINEFERQNFDELEVVKAIQYLFFKQWFELKKYANDKGIKIIGDMPIYSSPDSAEVFSNPEIFELDKDRFPINVAGSPPDYFSKDGQHWGNPIYNYDYIKSTGYEYFINRVSHLHKLYDVIRIDHFRGFASYYSIPASEKTAKNGVWRIGPGIELFNAIKGKLGDIDIIAEDLGYIDDTVIKLMNDTGFPGMNVIEFAFDGDVESHKYYTKNHIENSGSYLGTHDNNTFMGWFNNLDNTTKEKAVKFLHLEKGCENISAIKELFSSKSNLSIVMMQDLLGLDAKTRINTPGTVSEDNWSHRFSDDYLGKVDINEIKKIIKENERY